MKTDKIKIEICSNREWLGQYLHWDSDTSIGDIGEIEFFWDVLEYNLGDHGFQVCFSTGQRSTYHGWNGANLFRHMFGPLGTFSELDAMDQGILRDVLTFACEKADEYFDKRLGEVLSSG